jgi:hypothetical protein
MTDPNLDPIFAYLREHSGRYSLSALREQLLQTGYDPAEVDRAVAIYQQENPPTPAVPVWPKVLQVVGGNVVLALLAVLAMLPAGGWIALVGMVYSLIFWGELLGAIVLILERRSRLWGTALLVGFLLSIPIWILVLGGIFYSFIGGMNKWH